MNPELRQTLNTISRNLESANEVAQENIYTFTQLVIDPCVNGFKNVLVDCTSTCFPRRDDRLRRHRARSRGRSDLHFDFYDDWDDEEDDRYGAGSWGNDELDSLLAGRGRNTQPPRQRAMSYGTKNRRPAHTAVEDNPTIIPSSSYLGFLERFKWRPGARGQRYKPSSADLQEHPGALSMNGEVEPLMEEDEENEMERSNNRHKRQRSDTQASNSTSNSLSSRGDLIMGDEEDDAVPLDDEFAVMLSRQVTNTLRRPGMPGRKSNRTASSRSSKSIHSKRSASNKSLPPIPSPPTLERSDVEPPTVAALRAEEDHLRHEQEMEIAQKREIATQLAKDRGLQRDTIDSFESIEDKPPTNELEQITRAKSRSITPPTSTNEMEERLGFASPGSTTAGYHADSETEPFPSFPTSPAKETDDFNQPP